MEVYHAKNCIFQEKNGFINVHVKEKGLSFRD